MTPTERAEKITLHCENKYPVGPKNWYSEIEPLIAAEIAAAVADESRKMQEISELRIRQAVAIAREEAVAEFKADRKRLDKIIFRQGEAEAYADAAKIADTLHPKPNKTADEIRDAIRARAANTTSEVESDKAGVACHLCKDLIAGPVFQDYGRDAKRFFCVYCVAGTAYPKFREVEARAAEGK